MYLDAALRLHGYAMACHWNGHALAGPDPGIRFNYRVGRFVKSYIPIVHWDDALYYVQAQGYWILGNWRLYDETGDSRFRDLAVRCAHTLLSRQRDDGAWEYPNPEWRGRVATAEGTWGSLGLLETYRRTEDRDCLLGALRWYRFLIDEIGFVQRGDEFAVNYFARQDGDLVPNNSAFVLRFLADITATTGEQTFARHCPGLLGFLRQVQRPTGEMPYAIARTTGGSDRCHFQCYQYNAFQCLDVMAYYGLTGDTDCLPVVSGLTRFLRAGVGRDGRAFYDCGNKRRAVTYHAAAVAAALIGGTRLGYDDCTEPGCRAYEYVLRSQRDDGGFLYSTGDYGMLQDRRSYPRYLAMILVHLLDGHAGRTQTKKEEARSAC